MYCFHKSAVFINKRWETSIIFHGCHAVNTETFTFDQVMDYLKRLEKTSASVSTSVAGTTN